MLFFFQHCTGMTSPILFNLFYLLQVGDLTRDHHAVHFQNSDEWDFEDESNKHIKNVREARRLSEKQAKCTNISGHSNSVSKATNRSDVKQPSETLSDREQNIVRGVFVNRDATSLTAAGKDRRKCFTHGTEINMLDENELTNSHCTNHSKNLLEDDKRVQYRSCSESRLQDVEERESFLGDTRLKKRGTYEAPATLRSHFLSSMHDGK